MAQITGFGIVPSPHGGRGLMMAVGTVADVVTGGSWAVQLQTGGSQVMRNIQAPIVQVMKETYGSAIDVVATGSSNGYISVTLWDSGSLVPAVHSGTVDLAFLAFGGGGSI